MHVFLSSVGTDGDIFPYVGLGRVLRSRGHRVTLVVSERYRPLAARHGLGFCPLLSTEEHRELFEHPDFWHPWKTALLSARWGMRLLKRQYDLLAELTQGKETILISNPGVLAAGLVQERHGVPGVNLILQPWMIRSSVRPSVMHGFSWLQPAPPPVWKLFWRGFDFVVHWLVGAELNQLRASVGLPPANRVLETWLAPRLVLGMFPDWFGPPQSDWPPQLRLTDFPLFDGDPDAQLPAGLIEFCDAGPPPVVFTFGTGMRHSAGLFKAALEAVRLTGRRAILLTRYEDQLPNPLPPGVRYWTAAPFRQLFPRCAAVVHHGGIGTAAAALAAGTPQLVLPICFDQIDNGTRLQSLGAGEYLESSRSGRGIARALERVLSPATRERCGILAKRLGTAQGLVVAADHVEALMSGDESPQCAVRNS